MSSSNVQVFESWEFGDLRTVEEDGMILFCATDVAKALGYANPAKAVIDHCRPKDGFPKWKPITDSIGRTQQAKFISEPDVYRLIIHSNLPNAERFEAWVFEEVLPSIRSHGGYLTPSKIEEALLDPDTIIKLATNLKAEQEKRRALEAKNAEMAPKALFADAVSASDNCILIRDLAKVLTQSGFEIGQNRLYALLRRDGYMCKGENRPTQRAMEMGLFRVKETAVTHSDGRVTTSITPKVTGRGAVFFVNKYAGKAMA